MLGGNTGYHHRFGLWQIIICGLAVNDQWLFDEIEIQIGTYPGKLRRSIQGWPLAEGFIIVDVKCWLLILSDIIRFNPSFIVVIFGWDLLAEGNPQRRMTLTLEYHFKRVETLILSH